MTTFARVPRLLVGVSVPLILALGGACGDDEDGSSTAGGGGDGATATATTGSSTAGNGTSSSGGDGGDGPGVGGAGGEASTGEGGAAGTGGAGGAEGFPWQDAIDPDGAPSSTRLTARPLGSTEAGQGYYEYLPPGYPGDAQWPLLVFNHGLGENGDGGSQLGDVLATGIPDLIENDAWPVDRPFVVLMPQHPGDGCSTASEIQAMITHGLESYAIDPRYVYLTGLSCGAIGGWSYLQQHLDSQIAAFVPVAGDGRGAWNAEGCDLGRVAVWGFHGDADGTVSVDGTHVPLDGLATCPIPPARPSQKTIYPDVGHDSWSRTYDMSAGHDIYTWMLGFTR